jgi:hypothetical protein
MIFRVFREGGNCFPGFLKATLAVFFTKAIPVGRNKHRIYCLMRNDSVPFLICNDNPGQDTMRIINTRLGQRENDQRQPEIK